jgi:hypothetical protein
MWFAVCERGIGPVGTLDVDDFTSKITAEIEVRSSKLFLN